MTQSKYMNYGEGTWEFAAWKAIRENSLDVPNKRGESFEDLYDSEMFAAVGAKAWNLLKTWSVDDMVDLMARKQHDYGHQNVQKFGAAGVKVRLWDKIARYVNLTAKIAAGGQAQDDVGIREDAITDTLVDIIGYVTILFMVQRGTFASPLADPTSPVESLRPA